MLLPNTLLDVHDGEVSGHGRRWVAEDALLGQLASEGRRLAEVFRLGSPETTVPGLVWSAREVVLHTGAVHRWATDIVSRSLPTNEAGGSQAFAWSGSDETLTDWFLEGLDRLVECLDQAPADLQCFTFVPGTRARDFWIRRQAHETAIHRVDVESAAGVTVSEVEPWFAQDGLREIVGDFAREPQFAIRRSGRLVLIASDGPGWRVDFDTDGRGAGNRVSTGDFDCEDGDAAVCGTSDLLYRWAWNRPIDAGLALIGDLAVVQAWQESVRIL